MLKISIIIPIYNGEKYLVECIESVLRQSLNSFELILINDGSSDSSSQICDDYAAKDSRVKVVHKKNEGVSVARNVGLERACGEWVLFVDADDLLNENCLLEMLRLVDSTKQDIVLGSIDSIDHTKKVKRLKSFHDNNADNFLPIKHYALWGYMIKRSVIEKYKLRFVPGLAFSEDRVFLYQLAAVCNTLALTSKTMYTYRKNMESVCAGKNGVKKFEHHVLAAKQLFLQWISCENKELKRRLKKEIGHVIDLGMYQFVSLPYTRDDLRNVKGLFFEHFANKGLFWRSFIIQTFTYKRRALLK